MYPHLTPFGVIMKITASRSWNSARDVLDRDHYFWSQYSERLIGNWITYDTPMSNICAFATNLYVRHDYSKFKGDPKFVRDDDAQKAFSKLRSSIAGIYAWRVDHPHSQAEQQRVMKEAEFAFKQAYAFCPYSPEALYRFVNLLIRSGRIDDARMLAATSKMLDPHNGALDNLINELDRFKGQPPGAPAAAAAAAAAAAPSPELTRMETFFRTNPLSYTNTVALAQELAKRGQPDRVVQVADTLMATPRRRRQLRLPGRPNLRPAQRPAQARNGPHQVGRHEPQPGGLHGPGRHPGRPQQSHHRRGHPPLRPGHEQPAPSQGPQSQQPGSKPAHRPQVPRPPGPARVQGPSSRASNPVSPQSRAPPAQKAGGGFLFVRRCLRSTSGQTPPPPLPHSAS